MTACLRDTLDSVECSAQEIINRTKSHRLDNPLEAFELKTLINIRLQDLARHKEIALEAGILSADDAAEIMGLEARLAISLAKCELYLASPEKYREFVVHKKALVNRWTRRLTRVGFVSIAVLTVLIGMKVLRTLRPTIQRFDL
ncbi:uncharacterized protein LOC100903289 [Galendromus occidentalis]|uniref:Uncharacterized protein LOC100903289 n=1 Tax=Galendromus occidentalis TaxID=34638 RepID=A0AAJ6QYE5_9ACAR|nr:uncharacterized protein LOC100903289 [Galendromus occidentalis]